MKKRIVKKEFKLSFITRLLLSFGIPPKNLEEARHIFKNAVSVLDSSFKHWLKRKIQGKVPMWGPIWKKTFKVWVKACGTNVGELKGAFFTAIEYNFGSTQETEVTGDSPILEIVVDALIDTLKKQMTTADHKFIGNIAQGCWKQCPRSRWQQAAKRFLNECR